jgi:hypothetical protein
MSEKRAIVVDGSNVAFESQSQAGKPRMSNIIAVRDALRERGYEPIIIVDAALRHKIDDQDQLEALIDRQEVLQAPAGTDADFFVLETADQRELKVISNDTYREFREKYPWIRDRRVPVMFVDGLAQLYDLNLDEDDGDSATR